MDGRCVAVLDVMARQLPVARTLRCSGWEVDDRTGVVYPTDEWLLEVVDGRNYRAYAVCARTPDDAADSISGLISEPSTVAVYRYGLREDHQPFRVRIVEYRVEPGDRKPVHACATAVLCHVSGGTRFGRVLSEPQFEITADDHGDEVACPSGEYSVSVSEVGVGLRTSRYVVARDHNEAAEIVAQEHTESTPQYSHRTRWLEIYVRQMCITTDPYRIHVSCLRSWVIHRETEPCVPACSSLHHDWHHIIEHRTVRVSRCRQCGLHARWLSGYSSRYDRPVEAICYSSRDEWPVIP